MNDTAIKRELDDAITTVEIVLRRLRHTRQELDEAVPMEKTMLNMTEAAEYLGVSRHLVRTAIAEGSLPAQAVGTRGIRLISKAALDEWSGP